MHRVYFDGNDAIDNERYWLGLSKSIEDLAKIPGGPIEGTQVTIYMTGEIEMEATLEWDSKENVGLARWIKGTIRPNTETWE
jgi:hypothetical protein